MGALPTRVGRQSPRGGGRTSFIPFESLTDGILHKFSARGKIPIFHQSIYLFDKLRSEATSHHFSNHDGLDNIENI